jgi:hypothetical protein
MAKRRRSSLALSGEHARQALAILVQEGKLKVSEVKKALQRRDRLIRALRASLSAFETGAGTLGRRMLRGVPFPLGRKTSAPKRKVARRKPKISAATRAKYRLQGKYLSVLRPLSKEKRAKVKAIRAKAGVSKAIAAATKMAG